MKKIILSVLLLGIIMGLQAQELKVINLNKPDKSRNVTLMQALNKRHSERAFANKQLTHQDLSDLLWAANGINRPSEGKRTAPSANNVQGVDVYVCMKDGCYLYDAKAHQLQPVAKGDYRSAVARQQNFVTEAPVCLILVADLSRFNSGNPEQLLIVGACDTGIISQNISLFCSSAGLVTVPRMKMDKNALEKILKLKKSQHLLLNHPVGYAK